MAIGSNRNDLYSHKFPSIYKTFFSIYSFGIIYLSALLNWCFQNRLLGNRRISNFTRFKSFCMISLFSFSVFLILMKFLAAINVVGTIPLYICIASLFVSSLLMEHILIIKRYNIVEKSRWWGYFSVFLITLLMLGLFYIQPIVLYFVVKE